MPEEHRKKNLSGVRCSNATKDIIKAAQKEFMLARGEVANADTIISLAVPLLIAQLQVEQKRRK